MLQGVNSGNAEAEVRGESRVMRLMCLWIVRRGMRLISHSCLCGAPGGCFM